MRPIPNASSPVTTGSTKQAMHHPVLSFPVFMALLGVGSLGSHTGQSADLAGQGADLILGRIHRNADDVDALFPVGNAHTADDIFAVFMQNVIHRLHGCRIVDDDADDGNSCFQGKFLQSIKNEAAPRKMQLPQYTTRPPAGAGIGMILSELYLSPQCVISVSDQLLILL